MTSKEIRKELEKHSDFAVTAGQALLELEKYEKLIREARPSIKTALHLLNRILVEKVGE
ncbi:MAG: hypothetical protein ACYDG4_13500 [Desulfuromonadaceae bacterium]